MTVNEYLGAVLRNQTLTAGSKELEKLQQHRKDVEALLRNAYEDSSPRIRYGGSKAKGTMIKEAYDLDVICYFPHDDSGAGKNLKEIYENVNAVLSKEYYTERKRSAIRLKNADDLTDFHVDVVPGRFVDENEGDVYLYQASADKERLKTNLDIHIKYVRDSELVDAIRLMKLWNVRNNLQVKTFVLELLVIKLLNTKKNASLPTQLRHVWTQFHEKSDDLSIEDPANPSGNDLSELLNIARGSLALASAISLQYVEDSKWEAIFGEVEDTSKDEQIKSLRHVAEKISTPNKPWYSDH